MKTAVFVTAIPDMKWIRTHGPMCLEIIRAYFSHYGHEVLVLDKNPGISVKHNSWLWLLAHQIFPGYDYLLYWNLDILPNKFDEDIFNSLDLTKIAVCREADGSSTKFPYYYYNCGMAGIPKQYSQFCIDTFNRWKDDPNNWPSYEQYYVNMELGEHKIDVHEIPKKFNMFYGSDPSVAVCLHYSYTVYKETEPLATPVMEEHYKRLKEQGILK
jgi:hypothetical protein